VFLLEDNVRGSVGGGGSVRPLLPALSLNSHNHEIK